MMGSLFLCAFDTDTNQTKPEGFPTTECINYLAYLLINLHNEPISDYKIRHIKINNNDKDRYQCVGFD